MKAKVYVTLKDGIHDPQGTAICHALSALGFDGVQAVRAGKYFEIEMTPAPSGTSTPPIDKMCEKLLANTVIEKYRYEIIEDGIKMEGV
jgi:phosphoribosylformylglycinamidine synthase